MAHKLDPHKAIIDARLEAFPKLSAKRLFDEVRAAGYPGRYESVRNYVRVARRAGTLPSARVGSARQGATETAPFKLIDAVPGRVGTWLVGASGLVWCGAIDPMSPRG